MLLMWFVVVEEALDCTVVAAEGEVEDPDRVAVDAFGLMQPHCFHC